MNWKILCCVSAICLTGINSGFENKIECQESPVCPAGYSLTNQARGPNIVAVTACGTIFYCRAPIHQGQLQCAPGCFYAWVGNSYCDEACRVEACHFDGGDCKAAQPPSVTLPPDTCQESPTCPAGYSLTDQASGPDIVAVTSCGMVFHCRAPTSQDHPQCVPGCLWAWIGNSHCDPSCNVEACSFDGGDCNVDRPNSPMLPTGPCQERCPAGYSKTDETSGPNVIAVTQCGVSIRCKAQDHPQCVPGCLWAWIGNSHCDLACNVEACSFDGGDCNSSVCATTPCFNGATCVPSASGTTFECTCAPGWQGAHCDTVDVCFPNPCFHGGACTRLGTTYHCSCTAPWAGTTCSEAANACTYSPCMNGGTCVPQGQMYQCLCSDGWGGVTCEAAIAPSPCSPTPCQNGGTCLAQGSAYQCSCPPEWAGPQCEVAVVPSPCSPTPCLNGGTCTAQGLAYQCSCPPEWAGPTCIAAVPAPPLPGECNPVNCLVDPCSVARCDTHPTATCKANYCNGCHALWFLPSGEAVDCAAAGPCSPNPCVNGASCDAKGGYYRCRCPDGWTGKNCTEAVHPCSSKPCRNGGQCVEDSAGFQCTCVDGYSGDLCADAVHPCSTKPCLNGGKCVEDGAGFQCTCVDGYSGDLCADAVHPCSSKPCLNGGQCVEDGAGFECACVDGYSGDLCADEPDPCSAAPCLHGGRCTSAGGGGFDCSCPPGWAGLLCETEEPPIVGPSTSTVQGVTTPASHPPIIRP